MTENTTLRTLLLPELEAELQKTRAMLEATPDGQTAFKPHPRSWPLSRLAGHVAELPIFALTTLTAPDTNLATAGFKAFHMESRQQALAQFNENADALLTALKNTSDQTFHQPWTLSYGPHTIFSGSRYEAYRTMGINHLIHHRAQLGTYLRALDCPVPATYGPSADSQ